MKIELISLLNFSELFPVVKTLVLARLAILAFVMTAALETAAANFATLANSENKHVEKNAVVQENKTPESSLNIEASAARYASEPEEAIQIPIMQGEKIFLCELRIYLQDDKINIRIKLPSDSPIIKHRQWRWDAANQFYVSGEEEECALYIFLFKGDEKNFLADLWVWRSARNSSSGYADDCNCRILRKKNGIEIANCFPDAGALPWVGRYYANFAGESIPRFSQRNAEGSAGDVRAKSSWANGFWDIEMERLMDTENPDDVSFSENDIIQIGIFSTIKKNYTEDEWENSLLRIKPRKRGK